MKPAKTVPPSPKNSAAPKISRIHKNDLLLFLGILLLALLLFLGYQLFFQKPGASVKITVDGKLTKILPLNENTTYRIVSDNNHINILEIKDGFASVTNADCPDKLCVHQKKINKKGETLVCLPHKVIISVISSQEEKDFDGISN